MGTIISAPRLSKPATRPCPRATRRSLYTSSPGQRSSVRPTNESQNGSESRNEGVLRLTIAHSIWALSWGVSVGGGAGERSGIVAKGRGGWGVSVWGAGGRTGDGGRLRLGMLGGGLDAGEGGRLQLGVLGREDGEELLQLGESGGGGDW